MKRMYSDYYFYMILVSQKIHSNQLSLVLVLSPPGYRSDAWPRWGTTSWVNCGKEFQTFSRLETILFYQQIS